MLYPIVDSDAAMLRLDSDVKWYSSQKRALNGVRFVRGLVAKVPVCVFLCEDDVCANAAVLSIDL